MMVDFLSPLQNHGFFPALHLTLFVEFIEVPSGSTLVNLVYPCNGVIDGRYLVALASAVAISIEEIDDKGFAYLFVVLPIPIKLLRGLPFLLRRSLYNRFYGVVWFGYLHRQGRWYSLNHWLRSGLIRGILQTI